MLPTAPSAETIKKRRILPGKDSEVGRSESGEGSEMQKETLFFFFVCYKLEATRRTGMQKCEKGDSFAQGGEGARWLLNKNKDMN